MNKSTAKKINKILDKITDITFQLSEIRDELQEKYDAMGEVYRKDGSTKQDTEEGELLLDELGRLDDLVTNLEYAEDARIEI